MAPLRPLALKRLSGEDARVGAVALRLRRRPLATAVERGTSVTWLAPSLPVQSTFLERELAELRALELPVEAAAPSLGAGALRTLARRPVASVRVAARLQLAKAPRDRERGRLGYLALALRGMTLADALERRRSTVHATFADGVGTVAYCAGELARVPFTFTAHSPYSLWQGSELLRRQAEAAERVFCVSEDLEQRLHRFAPRARLTVVRCLGPREAPPRGSPEEPFLLLAVGRPLPLKGFETAIEAVALAVAAGANVRLELVGTGYGPGMAALVERAAVVKLGDRISFAGHLPNPLVLERLASALALLAPSEVQADGDRDGLPVSILDAAACGVPTIGTPVSGIPEFVVDGETGLVVPERDPEGLAAAIVRLCSDPALAARLGREARNAWSSGTTPAARSRSWPRPGSASRRRGPPVPRRDSIDLDVDQGHRSAGAASRHHRSAARRAGRGAEPPGRRDDPRHRPFVGLGRSAARRHLGLPGAPLLPDVARHQGALQADGPRRALGGAPAADHDVDLRPPARAGRRPLGEQPRWCALSVFVFAGLTPWTLFSAGITAAAAVLVANANLVTKVYFPRLILPIASAGSYLVDLGLSLVVLFGLMAWYGMYPTWRVVVLPALVVVTLVAAIGVGTWLAALNARYRDVRYIVPFMVQIWLFLCPVAYTAAMSRSSGAGSTT